MSVPEVMWRIQQRLLQKQEQQRYGKTGQIAVCDRIFNRRDADLSLDAARLSINANNTKLSTGGTIDLFGKFDYARYKNDWNAGFQTGNRWPPVFSYALSYKQQDEIGDARTNWELNRHFQFALLAKNFYTTGDKAYLDEFATLFADWNEKNPFLNGISWTSVMEVAIRAQNWIWAFCFLRLSEKVPRALLDALQTGIVNMADYIARHYSCYSSANNHLIVEACTVGTAGILAGHRQWTESATSILTRELRLQNYSDGVNKELSLHYQLFVMEAVGLLARLMRRNDIAIPEFWLATLGKMSRHVADCLGKSGEHVEFGDNDEGKILDLGGVGINYIQYVLELMSLLLPERFAACDDPQENIRWLFAAAEMDHVRNKPLYDNSASACYEEGGISILKSSDGRVLIGIDHAALGFGPIAAHGHADALSFQLYVDGRPVFVDPGTYIYHTDIERRNAFRQTRNHNTVCVNGADQSEMLGAFLWGRKAECRLITHDIEGASQKIIAEHDGYRPHIHRRTFEFDGLRELSIVDLITEWKDGMDCRAAFLLAPDIDVCLENDHTVVLSFADAQCTLETEGQITLEKTEYSPTYNHLETTNVLRVSMRAGQCRTVIRVADTGCVDVRSAFN